MTTIQEMIDGVDLEEMSSNTAAGIAGKNWTTSIKLARQLASVYKGIKGSLGKSEMSDKHKKEVEQCFVDASKCLKRAAAIFNDYS